MNRILVSYVLVALSVTLVACDTNDRFSHKKIEVMDAGKDSNVDGEPNVCDLAKCPKPVMGVACCTPLAQCGMDPTGVGLGCVANPGGRASEQVCDLHDCPKPTVGIACCTPFAQCGSDPFSSGLFCFANPPVSSGPIDDAGQCDSTECPVSEDGPAACCQANGACGVDTLGIGICFAPPPKVDASVPVVSTKPPKDPSVDGQCPSFTGTFGPIWGCCSDYGVCGTFDTNADKCLLPVGTQIPVLSDDPEDAAALVFPRCAPPK